MKPNPYLANRNLLREIALSKASYCWFAQDKFAAYDAIVQEGEPLDFAGLALTLKKRPDEIVIRVMTDRHIPRDPDDPRAARRGGGKRTNFKPFEHMALINGRPEIVGRSHWIGSLSNGEFSTTHGELTRDLVEALMLVVQRYAMRSNWRGYSYRDEMEGEALINLVEGALKFDESRGNNPFAYYSQAVTNAFIKILNKEKRQAAIRDDLLIDAGYRPSFGRQIDDALKSQGL